MSKEWGKKNGVALAAGLAAIAWVGVVLISGWGANWTGIDWDFERTGQLGDSFGVLSATMAGLAAYFAFRTYQAARDERKGLERRAAETSFLNLLERRSDVLERVRESRTYFGSISPKTKEYIGPAAIDLIARNIREERKRGTGDFPVKFLRATVNVSGLPNLLRFTYHIVAFCQRQFSEIDHAEPMVKVDPAYQYVRLLRAQLSDSELVIIALNCAYGAGYEKFKPLVERYAILHNMNSDDRVTFALSDLFAPSAFGLEEEDRVPTADTPPQEWFDALEDGETDPKET